MDPQHLAYLEVDGVGEQTLDEVELEAVDGALAAARQPHDPLLVGTVRSNCGHTDSAVGLVGLAKLVVTIESGVIPATINHRSDSNNIRALSEGRIKVRFRPTEKQKTAQNSNNISSLF